MANAAGNYAPGGTKLDFNGYYVYGAWYLTGESRAAAYQLSGFNPATFGQIDIKNRLGAYLNRAYPNTFLMRVQADWRAIRWRHDAPAKYTYFGEKAHFS